MPTTAMWLTVGSKSTDYSDPTAPVFKVCCHEWTRSQYLPSYGWGTGFWCQTPKTNLKERAVPHFLGLTMPFRWDAFHSISLISHIWCAHKICMLYSGWGVCMAHIYIILFLLLYYFLAHEVRTSVMVNLVHALWGMATQLRPLLQERHVGKSTWSQ